MKKIISSLIIILFVAFNSFANNLTGEWQGTRFQYNETKSKYIAEFEYKYNLTQEGNQVKGTAYIQSQNGKFAEIAVRGFVEGDKFYFEEYEVINATRDEGYLWCLKKGVLNITEEKGKINLVGATPSFVEYYGFECTGGVTQLSKDKISISEKEVKEIADKENALDVTVYPNPFVQSTQVAFHIDTKQLVTIDVVNIQGRVLQMLENQTLDAGNYTYTFTPNENESSQYFYIRLKLGDKTITRAIQKAQGVELR